MQVEEGKMEANEVDADTMCRCHLHGQIRAEKQQRMRSRSRIGGQEVVGCVSRCDKCE